MGRIFKLLVTGLESISSSASDLTDRAEISLPADLSADTSIGDLKVLSTNAQTMLRLSLLSAWAQLQIASTEQRYLEGIIQPFVARLTPLWLSSLQDFAKLRFEPDISSSLGGIGGGQDLNELYAALNRETLLDFYQDTWLNLIDAIAVLVDKDSGSVFDALDTRQSASAVDSEKAAPAGKSLSFREEPAAFFFILYGLAFEALVTQSRDNPSQTLKILQALKKILRPAVSGIAIYQDTVFDETMDILDRLALTEGLVIQNALVEITRGLALDHQVAKAGTEREEKLSDDIEQLFELTRVMILILAGMIPTLSYPSKQQPQSLGGDAVALIRTAMEALVDVAEVFPTVIKADLHACIMNIFCSILAFGGFQSTVVPQVFPTFKRFLRSITSSSKPRDVERLIRGCLWQFLKILRNAQRREQEFALHCAKNTLLATTILLTSVGVTLSANEELIRQALEEILGCLHDVGLATVAANCLRSFLPTSPKSPSDEAIFRYLFPRLVYFLVDTSVEDPENVRVIISHTIASTMQTMPSGSRSALCAMVLPILLKRASLEGPSVHQEIAGRLLEVAGADQAAFRGLVGQMGGEQHKFLESLLRSQSGHPRQNEVDSDEADVKPSIALRMDF
jgi:HEAT repeat-containing protein 5